MAAGHDSLRSSTRDTEWNNLFNDYLDDTSNAVQSGFGAAAGGVVGAFGGRAIGMTIGGAIGFLAGPAGAAVGVYAGGQIGAWAGGLVAGVATGLAVNYYNNWADGDYDAIRTDSNIISFKGVSDYGSDSLKWKYETYDGIDINYIMQKGSSKLNASNLCKEKEYIGTIKSEYFEGCNDIDLIKAGSGNDVLLGMGGNDELQGENGNDVANGGDGNDSIVGGGGTDTLNGGYGNDTIKGSTGNDSNYGDAGNDIIYGGTGDSGADGNDKLYGDNGNDSLYGGTGADTLYGGNENDYINGNEGEDTLYGGAGSDKFAISANSGHDTIKDFVLGSDVIWFRDPGGPQKLADLEFSDMKTHVGPYNSASNTSYIRSLTVEFDGDSISLNLVPNVRYGQFTPATLEILSPLSENQVRVLLEDAFSFV